MFFVVHFLLKIVLFRQQYKSLFWCVGALSPHWETFNKFFFIMKHLIFSSFSSLLSLLSVRSGAAAEAASRNRFLITLLRSDGAKKSFIFFFCVLVIITGLGGVVQVNLRTIPTINLIYKSKLTKGTLVSLTKVYDCQKLELVSFN